jgi:hypothetical protein
MIVEQRPDLLCIWLAMNPDAACHVDGGALLACAFSV